MVRVKFVAESNGKFFNLKQSGATLVFLPNNFVDDNAYLHIYIVSKPHIYNLSEFSYSGNFHKVRISRN